MVNVNKTFVLLTAIAYTVFLTVVSLITIGDIPDLGTDFNDKIYHFLAYFILAFIWITYAKNEKSIRIAFVLLIVFGILLEIIQHKINIARMYDVYDLIANCLGVVIGTLFAYKFTVVKLK